jgi:hypothetical protein
MGSNTWDSVKFFGIAFAGVLTMAAVIFLPIRAFQHNLDTRDCGGSVKPVDTPRSSWTTRSSPGTASFKQTPETGCPFL